LPKPPAAATGALRVALSLSCLGVLLLGIIPGFIMRLAELAAGMFVF